jgi:hypothetical protein
VKGIKRWRPSGRRGDRRVECFHTCQHGFCSSMILHVMELVCYFAEYSCIKKLNTNFEFLNGIV